MGIKTHRYTTSQKIAYIVIGIIIVFVALYLLLLLFSISGPPQFSTFVLCSTGFTCNGLFVNTNGTVSFMMTQNTGSTFYDVEFACIETSANITAFLNSTVKTTNVTMLSGVSTEATNVQCYNYSNQPVKSFTASVYSGQLWLIYKTSSSGARISNRVGTIEVK